MTILQRVGYYLGGFSIGLIIVAFFFNAKKTSCSYGPQARVLKNLRTKSLHYTDAVQRKDSSVVNYLLRHGDVNFSESETRKKPCAVYRIEGKYQTDSRSMTIENCDTTATVIALE